MVLKSVTKMENYLFRYNSSSFVHFFIPQSELDKKFFTALTNLSPPCSRPKDERRDHILITTSRYDPSRIFCPHLSLFLLCQLPARGTCSRLSMTRTRYSGNNSYISFSLFLYMLDTHPLSNRGYHLR